MDVGSCPPRQIELLNPTQSAPAPGELETFPRITLSQEAIVCIESLRKDAQSASTNQQQPHRRHFQRNRQRLSRFRTQPITFAEIAEVDEPIDDVPKHSMSKNR